MRVARRSAAALLALLVLLLAGTPAAAELTERGDLFVTFNGGLSPSALPRDRLAPIAVSIEGRIRVPSGSPPALREIEIELNSAGHLDTTGLPRCRRSQVAAATTAQALAACRAALIGEGSFAAASNFPEQPAAPASGHILAFNAAHHGHAAILASIYGTRPSSSSRTFLFTLRHPRGRWGTALRAHLPPRLNPHGYVKRIALRLFRTYIYRGRRHSYLSAACATPPGIPIASFAFARAAMAFSDGRRLASTLTRSCRVRR